MRGLASLSTDDRMKTLWLFLTAVLGFWQAVTATATLPAPASAPAPITVTDAPPPGLEDYLRQKMARKRIPGMQVAVVRDGRVVFSGHYGVANLQDQVAVTAQSVFSINSATKTFTGVAILQLAQDGKLELDAPISRYLEGLPPTWQSIRVRQLLNHTSGLPDILVPPRAQGTGVLVGGGSDEQAWEQVQTLPMDFATGTAYRYNQTNYAILGKIIDKLSGQPFTEFIRSRQFAPAGMHAASFGDSRDVTAHRAVPYRYPQGAGSVRAGPLENAFDEFPAILRTGAGINASADDIALWLLALQDGRLLDSEHRAELWSAGKFNDGRPTSWANGWPVVAREEHPAVAGIGGRRSAFYVYPQDHLSVVVLTNLAGANPEEFIDEIAGFWLPELSVANGGGLPRNVKTLRKALIAHDWRDGAARMTELKRADPEFAVSEDQLNGWGWRLVADEGKTREGLAVLELNTVLYPRSANTYDTLAEAYALGGQRAAAIHNYQRSLALDPGNTHAQDELRKLGATPPSPATTSRH
jgi:CubicO group peptidase (beta-lactamase class C family)